jgi:hypothetical protein
MANEWEFCISWIPNDIMPVSTSTTVCQSTKCMVWDECCLSEVHVRNGLCTLWVSRSKYVMLYVIIGW